MKPTYPLSEAVMVNALRKVGLETEIIVTTLDGEDREIWIFWFEEHDIAVTEWFDELKSMCIWDIRDQVQKKFIDKKKWLKTYAALS